MATTEDQARQYAKWMGIMYGLVVGIELSGRHAIEYAEIEQMMGKQGCSPEMLAKVVKELHRYSTVMKRAEADH